MIAVSIGSAVVFGIVGGVVAAVVLYALCAIHERRAS